MRQLQQYVKKKEDGETKRYIDLLLYLPMSYGVNGKMVEELFCQQLYPNCDVKTLLKETISRFSALR